MCNTMFNIDSNYRTMIVSYLLNLIGMTGNLIIIIYVLKWSSG